MRKCRRKIEIEKNYCTILDLNTNILVGIAKILQIQNVESFCQIDMNNKIFLFYLEVPKDAGLAIITIFE